MVQFDAISAAGRETFLALNNDDRFEPVVISWRNDFSDVRAVPAGSVADLLIDQHFIAADALIYHFGIYASLFDAMLLGNGIGVQIAKYHNVTPAEFVTAGSRSLADASHRQISNMQHLDELWPDSEVNGADLIARGVPAEKILTVPLPVEAPTMRTLRQKKITTINILFVGRIVQSKGVLDLVTAIRYVRLATSFPISVKIAGNELFSDTSYMETVRLAIQSSDASIEMLGTVTDLELQELYHASHIFAIPSYHEGFCKTVIEALRGGCVPIGYAAQNLPNICNGFGRLVEPGDVQGLAIAISEVSEALLRCSQDSLDDTLPLDCGTLSIAEFDDRVAPYVRAFSGRRYAETVRKRVAHLVGSRRAHRHRVSSH